MSARNKSVLAPRFKGLRARDDNTSRVGAANRKKGTAPEIALRRLLFASGLRFRLHSGDLPGRPDLVIRRHKLAIFCDGDFWHGRRWHVRKAKLASGWNAAYWVAKIERNRERDRKVTKALQQLGWTVIRVWETDVERKPLSVASSPIVTVSAP